ncbi:hypothetical protein BDE36_4698 [Arcticibacter tournemirensis]|nr:hypothetical protein BDE36_4698 [Arcticibacter tournemirensis]
MANRIEGVFSGTLFFYEYDKLKRVSQIAIQKIIAVFQRQTNILFIYSY